VRSFQSLASVTVAVLSLPTAAPGQAGKTADVIRVPQQAPTIGTAVARASPGDTILVSRGVYREAVTVPGDKRGITIRGVDRNGVVLDGGDTRKTAIAVNADGVTIENLSAHNYQVNGFYWEDVKGFRGSYLTVWNVLGYGIYAEGSTDGVLDHDYVSGAADAAYYVGECNPCRTTLRQLVARLSAVGYSGTNASGGIVIRDSLWDRNAIGILPNSYANEKKAPQRAALITGNVVVASGRARVPLVTPLAGFYGIGIGIAGGNANRVQNNRVTNSLRYGVAVFPTAFWISIDPRPRPPGKQTPWRPARNVVRANTVRGSGVADLALSAGSGRLNCFASNRSRTTLPSHLQGACTRVVKGDESVSRALTAPLKTMLKRAGRRLRPLPYTAMPVPPPQPNMPGRLR
jgi:parallel beta helix pectate lyase-like protein